MDGEGSSSANPSGVQGVCPAGWHLPSDSEWTQLIDYLNDEHDIENSYSVESAANALKSCRQVDSPLGGECATSQHPRWDSQSTHFGTDQFEFSALPGGGRTATGNFNYIGERGYWRSATQYRDNTAAMTMLMYSSSGFFDTSAIWWGNAFSVRCVRD